MKRKNNQPADEALTLIADYTLSKIAFNETALHTARLALADSLGCAILSLRFKECTKLLGPLMPDTVVPYGSRVPGTSYILDPVLAAFNIGMMIRWLDFNDTWLGKEWGHPSDNIGGLLALADHIAQKSRGSQGVSITVGDLLNWLIKAYEIQGGLSILNSFNQSGFDHVLLVKVATAAVAAAMLGFSRSQLIDTVSNAWIDAGPLRTYRHGTNTGSRKSWAAGDAASRGLFFALLTERGEMGYPTALSAKQWGFYDILMKGQPFAFQRPFGSYVIENILFKPVFPAEYHAQTAVEAAIQLHSTIGGNINGISGITIETQESAVRIIDKKGILNCPADRDHCLQYMVAIGLLKGRLTAEDYEEEASRDPRIGALRSKMQVVENPHYSAAYHEPDKRSVANAITLYFSDGRIPQRVEVEYPLGHPKRRQEAIPLLFEKFERNMRSHFSEKKAYELTRLFQNHEELCKMPLDDLMRTLF